MARDRALRHRCPHVFACRRVDQKVSRQTEQVFFRRSRRHASGGVFVLTRAPIRTASSHFEILEGGGSGPVRCAAGPLAYSVTGTGSEVVTAT